MNDGIIVSRYAKALLKFQKEGGSGDVLYRQVSFLVYCLNEIPQLKEVVMSSSVLPLDKVQSVLGTAIGEEVDPALTAFVRLVYDQRRMELFPRMLLSFIEQYRMDKGIKAGKLVTAVANQDFGEILRSGLQKKTGAEIHIEEVVDPEIIGGFILDIDGYRLDASVDAQLRRIRRHLIKEDNTIV